MGKARQEEENEDDGEARKEGDKKKDKEGKVRKEEENEGRWGGSRKEQNKWFDKDLNEEEINKVGF